MAGRAFQIIEVELLLGKPSVRPGHIMTFQADLFPLFSGHLTERDAVVGIVAGIADFLGDLGVTALRVLSLYPLVTFTTLRFRPCPMRGVLVLRDRRYPLVTGRALHSIPRVL